MTRNTVVWLLVILIIGIGGYFTYTYLKESPPSFLIKLFTKTEPPPLPEGDLASLDVADDFTPTIFSREVPGARVMTRDPKGAMLVSLTSSGKIVVLNDADSDGKAESPKTVLEGLKRPHGIYATCIDGNNCVLYVAESDALKVYSYNPDAQTADYRRTITTFPATQGHLTRTILPHPDGKHLLVSIGSSCDVCHETDSKRASIVSVDLETDDTYIYASGLRNSVFMAVNPIDGAIWATDNGRDLIGDDIPPDEVNLIKEGGYYGWPICYGQNVYDTDYNARPDNPNPCAGFIPAHIDLQAHSAPLGLAFIPEEGWPGELHNDLLVAYHGSSSWNRSVPTGYKVVRWNLDDDGNVDGGPYDFVTGFMPEGGTSDDAVGRPVGILTEPGGTFYVSDDYAGAIYRIVWNGVR